MIFPGDDPDGQARYLARLEERVAALEGLTSDPFPDMPEPSGGGCTEIYGVVGYPSNPVG